MTLQESLLDWYSHAKRPLPWRFTTDPYAIWVSEIMCQQTQVKTAEPYYLRWMERFPTAESLALATEHDVLSLWQGLGYYRRAKMLLSGVRWMLENGWPTSAAEWLKVPGVGKYTAGAIASICLGEQVAAVDGNVIRVYSRICADPSSLPLLSKNAEKWDAELVPSDSPGEWNQALMELGASICTPRSPKCDECPVWDFCRAAREGIQEQFPTKPANTEQRTILKNCIAAHCRGKLGLRQITEGPWWVGMWEFPSGSLSTGEVLEFNHVVTKHKIHFTAAFVELDHQDEQLSWFDERELAELPLPAPMRRIADWALVLTRADAPAVC